MQVKQLVERNKHLYLWRIAVFVLWGLSCLLSLFFFSIKARAKSVVSTLICDVKLCLWVPMDMITPVLYVWKDYKPDQRITQLKLDWVREAHECDIMTRRTEVNSHKHIGLELCICFKSCKHMPFPKNIQCRCVETISVIKTLLNVPYVSAT